MHGNHNHDNYKENKDPHGNDTSRGRIHIGNHNGTHYRIDTRDGRPNSNIYGVQALQQSDPKRLASDEIRGTNAQNLR
jgi:hypothetical protein